MSLEAPREDRRHTPNTEGGRSEFQRDRDRVLYTEAFRRLSGVSQVAYTGETEMYHDRLSHSLKVAQVGRRIAEYLLPDNDNEDLGVPLEPDVVETAALAHDIGHPPFGHPAEQELDRLIQDKGVAEGFEGNAQSLRVLSHVAVHPETETRRSTDQRGPTTKFNENETESETDEDGEIDKSDETDEPEVESEEDSTASGNTGGPEEIDNLQTDPRGLNLTRASLNATIKYPWKRSAESGDENIWGEDESDKFGRYSSEKAVFEWARQGADGKRRCLEAEIMDWADDLVYAVHDVEDFYRAGVIPLEQILRERTEERKEFIEDYLPEDGDSPPDKFGNEDAVQEMLNNIASYSGIERQFRGTRGDRERLKDLSSWLIGKYVGDDEEEDWDITVNPNPTDAERYLDVDARLRKEVSVLKYMLVKYVIENPTLQAQRRGEQKVIEELFEILYRAVTPETEDCRSEDVDIIHHPFREEAKQLKQEGTTKERVRLVADIITSMTEQQAIRLHKRLTGDTPGSLREYIVN